jgi:circadian clock protein KaiC
MEKEEESAEKLSKNYNIDGKPTGNKDSPATNQNDIPDVQWVKVGVPGFDALITNGIPKGSAVLVSGGPGTGKTTFCLQLIEEACKKGESCLYLTFEESAISLKQHMKSYKWNPTILEKEGLLVIKKMQPFDISRSIEALLARANKELVIELDEIEGVIPKGFKPTIIVLDSLSAVSSAFGSKEEGYRIYIDQQFEFFKKSGATSFLITEVEQDANKYSKSGIEEFLADAVIVFYNLRNKSVRSNAIEILKVRGTMHQKKIVPFKMMSDKGIVIYPDEMSIT